MKKTSCLIAMLVFSGYFFPQPCSYVNNQYCQSYDSLINNRIFNSELFLLPNNSSNVWQMGKPQKNFIDSAYYPSINGNVCLVTDSVNVIPANNISSVIFKIIENSFCEPLTWDAQFGDPGSPFFCAQLKYDLDSLKDSLVIDYKFNNGPWSKKNFYLFNTSGQALPNPLTGRKDWFGLSPSFFSALFDTSAAFDTVSIRFTVYSDSINSNNDGVAIDNFFVGEQFPSGISELSKKLEIKAFPNPANNSISIFFKNKNNSSSQLSIYNSVGEIVLQKDVGKQEGEIKYTTDISNLSEGIYFLKVQTGGLFISRKFIKQ